jgi:hypothetical protein
MKTRKSEIHPDLALALAAVRKAMTLPPCDERSRLLQLALALDPEAKASGPLP